MTRTYKPVTKEEVKKIIDNHLSANPKSQQVIGFELGRVQSFVYHIVNQYKDGNKKILAMYADNTESYRAKGNAKHTTEKADEPVVLMHTNKGKVPVKLPFKPDNERITVKSKVPLEQKPAPAKRAPEAILPGKHAAIPHKLSEAYKNLDRKELAFLKDAKCSNDFVTAYFKEFGFDSKTVSMLGEVWKRREDILKYEFDKENHTVRKPLVSTIEMPLVIDPRKASALAHEDVAIAKINNNIALMNRLYQEVIDLQKEVITSISTLTESATA